MLDITDFDGQHYAKMEADDRYWESREGRIELAEERLDVPGLLCAWANGCEVDRACAFGFIRDLLTLAGDTKLSATNIVLALRGHVHPAFIGCDDEDGLEGVKSLIDFLEHQAARRDKAAYRRFRHQLAEASEE